MQRAEGKHSFRCSHPSCSCFSCGSKYAVYDSQAFHSKHEVMASDHVETHLQPAASIVSKCRIHTLEQYMVSPVTHHSL